MISARTALSLSRARMNHPMSNWAEIPVSWTSCEKTTKQWQLPVIRPLNVTSRTHVAALHCLRGIVVLKLLRVAFRRTVFNLYLQDFFHDTLPGIPLGGNFHVQRYSLHTLDLHLMHAVTGHFMRSVDQLLVETLRAKKRWVQLLNNLLQPSLSLTDNVSDKIIDTIQVFHWQKLSIINSQCSWIHIRVHYMLYLPNNMLINNR